MRQQSDKESKEKTDKRLYNTRVLLHAMGNGLRENIERSIFSASDIEALGLPFILDYVERYSKLDIESIAKIKTRSEILLVNAERLFAAWENSSKSGAHRMRRKIIREWYFNKLELSDIVQKFNRTEKIILTQLGIALDELSVYFFGKDGLQLSGDGVKRHASKRS